VPSSGANPPVLAPFGQHRYRAAVGWRRRTQRQLNDERRLAALHLLEASPVALTQLTPFASALAASAGPRAQCCISRGSHAATQRWRRDQVLDWPTKLLDRPTKLQEIVSRSAGDTTLLQFLHVEQVLV